MNAHHRRREHNRRVMFASRGAPPLQAGSIVRLTKVRTLRLNGEMGAFQPGFSVTGYITALPALGHPVVLDPVVACRYHKRWMWFRTSAVVSFRGRTLETENSVWRLTHVLTIA